MPITSYLAHPHRGKKTKLIEALTLFKNCEVIPAKNKDLLVVVTETKDIIEEENLKEKMEAISSLKMLVLVSGFSKP